MLLCVFCVFFFQAEDGIRDLVRSRGLGDVYKRQGNCDLFVLAIYADECHCTWRIPRQQGLCRRLRGRPVVCLLYTSDAADERSSVDLGGRRIIKKKKKDEHRWNDLLTSTKRSISDATEEQR